MKIQEKQEYRITPPGACEKTIPVLQFYQRIKMSEIRCLDFRAFLLWKGLQYMKKYVLKRLLQLIPILLAITFLSYGMMRVAGSDVVEQKMENTGSDISQEVVDAAREELGLDKPFLTQYVVWLGGLLCGDMGISYVSGKPVFSTFISKLPATSASDVHIDSADDFDFCSVRYFIGGSSKPVFRLSDPDMQLYRQQLAEFLCGAAADVSVLLHPAWLVPGDCRPGSVAKSVALPALTTGDCHVAPSISARYGLRCWMN